MSPYTQKGRRDPGEHQNYPDDMHSKTSSQIGAHASANPLLRHLQD